MATKGNYSAAIQRIAQKNVGFNRSLFEDMSDMKNWLCVHVTGYMPLRNKNGECYIPTTAMATDYKYARATVHFTLNQIVRSHMSGNWDLRPIVVLTPYNDVVKKNGTPRMVATEDTFFIPNPDTGLMLPESTHIIKPNNKTLFNIGDIISTYKTDKFTDEEIEIILSFVDQYDRQLYEKYANVAFSKEEIEDMMQWEGKLVRESYKKAKNKRDFLRGLLEENRMAILIKFLREAVVRMTMDRMGYNYVCSHEDAISNDVADIAAAKGIHSTGSDKGHSGTLECEFEKIGCGLLGLIQMCETNDIEKIYKYCADGETKELAELILNNKPLGVYQAYLDRLNSHVDFLSWEANHRLQQAQTYPDDPYLFEQAEKASDLLKYADKLKQCGIKAYENPYLDVVLHRNADRLEQDFAKALEKLKQTSNYPLLNKMLTDLVKNGKKWYKTPDGWQPEPDYKDYDILKMYDFGRGM